MPNVTYTKTSHSTLSGKEPEDGSQDKKDSPLDDCHIVVPHVVKGFTFVFYWWTLLGQSLSMISKLSMGIYAQRSNKHVLSSIWFKMIENGCTALKKPNALQLVSVNIYSIYTWYSSNIIYLFFRSKS